MYIVSYHTPYLTYEKFTPFTTYENVSMEFKFFLAHVEFAKFEFNILHDFLNDNSQRCDDSKINKNFDLCSGNSNSIMNDSSDKFHE